MILIHAPPVDLFPVLNEEPQFISSFIEGNLSCVQFLLQMWL